jgi:NAD(P)-dependent dehydrogenase (short-subunit alcohol dehydrogenase family)
MRAVVVTGVSTGIGRGIATVLGRNGFHVFGSVRHADHGRDFEAALGGKGTALQFDVTDQAAVRTAAELVRDRVGAKGLAGLVNNAGITVQGPLQSIDLDALRRQFEVNTIAAIGVAQAFLPLLGAAAPFRAEPGRIVNISSVSGRIALPFVGPYAASKFALEGLSDSLRRELAVYGIKVIVIQPGSIDTPLWDKGAAHDIERYRGTPYYSSLGWFRNAALKIGRGGLPPEAVGEAVLKALTAAKPKARYVVQRGGPLRFQITRHLPSRLLDRQIARRFRLTPPKR